MTILREVDRWTGTRVRGGRAEPLVALSPSWSPSRCHTPYRGIRTGSLWEGREAAALVWGLLVGIEGRKAARREKLRIVPARLEWDYPWGVVQVVAAQDAVGGGAASLSCLRLADGVP